MDVLLVEDEPLVREAVAEALGEAGLDVAQADSAEHALAAVGLAADAAASAAASSSAPPAGTGAATPPPPPPAPPAVLVTDVNLASAADEAALDGFALVAALRRRWPTLGVVVITGRMANLARCAELAPPERHFLKPFAPEDLVRAVRELAAPPASASER